jgi:phage-related baseplate assembly protein
MARSNAPNTVRMFGRIVSLRDFEDAARELAVVAKARAALVWGGEEQYVALTVAGENGAVLDAASLKEVSDDLDTRRDVNRKMVVRAHQSLAVKISARIQVNPAWRLEDAKAAAGAAIQALFAFDNRELGQPAYASDVYRVAQAVEGVIAIDLDAFTLAAGDVKSYHLLKLSAADLDLRPQFEALNEQ